MIVASLGGMVAMVSRLKASLSLRRLTKCAGVAQSVEQLIRNQ